MKKYYLKQVYFFKVWLHFILFINILFSLFITITVTINDNINIKLLKRTTVQFQINCLY